MMPFQIIRNDITKVKADAIVNTVNPNVEIGDGVESAIYQAAGREELLAARAEFGFLEAGEVRMTPAFHLHAKHIIHASGPVWQGGTQNEGEMLRRCYDSALQLAYQNKCRSIAFPLMGTGSYRFPKELGMQIAVDAFRDFLEEHELEITLVVFESSAYKISGELFQEIRSYIDENDVQHALFAEYQHDGLPEESEIEFSDEQLSRRGRQSTPHRITPAPVGSFAEAKLSDEQPKKKSLEDTLKGIYTESFGKHLQKMINKKGLKNSQVYVAANMSKQYFSKLMNGQVTPSREKILALAVGLHLNMDEAMDFMKLAGYAFSPISQTDSVVRYFIENEDYNVIKIDIVLFDFGLDPLS